MPFEIRDQNTLLFLPLFLAVNQVPSSSPWREPGSNLCFPLLLGVNRRANLSLFLFRALKSEVNFGNLKLANFLQLFLSNLEGFIFYGPHIFFSPFTFLFSSFFPPTKHPNFYFLFTFLLYHFFPLIFPFYQTHPKSPFDYYLGQLA